MHSTVDYIEITGITSLNTLLISNLKRLRPQDLKARIATMAALARGISQHSEMMGLGKQIMLYMCSPLICVSLC